MRTGHFAFAYLALQAYLVNIANAQCPGNNADWYVKWETETCAENCNGPIGGPCGGCAMPWDNLYASAELCCQHKLPYKHPGWCAETSEATPYIGSGKWYTKYDGAKCVNDCALGAGQWDACGGIIEDAHVDLYTTERDCCDTSLSWVDGDLCVSNSETGTTGTNKYYAVNPGGKCLRDCDPGQLQGAVGCARVPDSNRVMYNSLIGCCSGAQSWVDGHYCYFRSIDGYSDQWVVDSSSNTRCVQDCDPASPLCARAMPDTTVPSIMFDSARDCCDKQLNWIDKDKCTADSQGFGTGEFYTDYPGKKCAQDCPVSTDPLKAACGGDPPYATAPRFVSASECCEKSLSWLNFHGCVGRTHDEAPHSTNEWYVAWTPTPKCVRSCVVGSAPDCGGLKENWAPGYGADGADKDACCSSIHWVPNCI